MSINMDGDGVSYSDHDVHHIRHQVQVAPGSGGDDVSPVVVEEFEITERGLDPDELAELRAMRVQVGATAGAGQAQDSRGEFSFQIDAGFNLSEDDSLHNAGSTRTSLDPDGDGTDEILSDITDTDEVGQIWSYADNFSIGFDDDNNGNGAGGQSSSVAETVNMADLFGSGPFVDSADDFNSIVTAGADNVIENFGVDITYSLYYNVIEQEGGRTRFGR